MPPCGLNFGISKRGFFALIPAGNLFNLGMMNFLVAILCVEVTPYLTKGSGMTGNST